MSLLASAINSDVRQKTYTDARTRYWVKLFPNELRAVNEFRQERGLKPLAMVDGKPQTAL